MATNRELLSKIKDKLQVVTSLAKELDYNECTEEDLDTLRDTIIKTVEKLEVDLVATADAMYDTIFKEEKEVKDDRSASEDDSEFE